MKLLEAHVFECLGVAWAVHETVGRFTTAALMWLESGGQADAADLARRFEVQRLVDLKPQPRADADSAAPLDQPQRRRRRLQQR